MSCRPPLMAGSGKGLETSGSGSVAGVAGMVVVIGVMHVAEAGLRVPGFRHAAGGKLVLRRQHLADRPPADQLPRQIDDRTEEHTAELQSIMSISYPVICLKKK